jgi:hypothetical protein
MPASRTGTTLPASRIPQRLDELTPAWLTAALAEHLRGARVERVTCEPLGEGEGFVGQLARLRLRLDREVPGAPTRVIAKLPTSIARNRATGEMLGAYEREILFYRELAPRVGYRTPRLYHADMDESPASKHGPAIVRFIDRLPVWLIRLLMRLFHWLGRHSPRRYVLLLEDLAPAELGDQVAGRDAAGCLPVVRAIARAQADLWRAERIEGRYWVARLDLGLRVTHQLFRDSRGAFEARFAARLGAEGRALLDWLDANAPALLAALHAQAPRTLVHGDFRLDNLFFDGTPDPLVVDWQGVANGPGVYDLAYFLSGTLPPHTSRDDEEALVRAYHHALVGAGVSDYPFAACLRDYRRCTLLGLHRLVTIDWVDLGEARGAELLDVWVERLMGRLHGMEVEALR